MFRLGILVDSIWVFPDSLIGISAFLPRPHFHINLFTTKDAALRFKQHYKTVLLNIDDEETAALVKKVYNSLAVSPYLLHPKLQDLSKIENLSG